MTDTLFKEVHYSLGGLIGDIGLGRIGLPDIQRPFVWANAKVRDLFDSMYRGYPVGYFLFWQTAPRVWRPRSSAMRTSKRRRRCSSWTGSSA
ncbi:DUF262 domain-containing protein [Mitsuaria sp. TWR114]|uniref:DUF262 domain-containing protein n=1 Tax=Mitsuaria sp. TWR114 TaxID=2601731 RepID=UPI001C9A5535|nr:DUF262 domain-containing protein [Mitsuaria sp. TWR114]